MQNSKSGRVINMIDAKRKIEVTKILRGMALVYPTEITDELVQIYCLVLQELSIQELNQAVIRYMRSDIAFFPKPGQLLAMLKPTDEDQAAEVAARILTAMRKYGGDYPEHHQKARECMGEIGWHVVQLQGGWSAMLTNTSLDTDIGQAQWRKLALSVIRKDSLGQLGETPSLQSKEQKGLQGLSDIMKKALDYKTKAVQGK